MTGYLNEVKLIGNLGGDPEARSMTAGGEVVTFSLATTQRWTDRQSGERKSLTHWHRVVIFDEPKGKVARQYLRKGSACFVSGQLQTRSYTDREGIKRSVTEVVLQKFGGDLQLLDGRQGEAAPPVGETGVGAGPLAPDGALDDDVPF